MSDLTLAVAQSIAAPRHVAENVSGHLRLATVAAEHGAQLVLFPELSLTGYSHQLTLEDALCATDERLRPLQALADAAGMIIVAGAPIASPAGLHIGAMSFVPGTGIEIYLKRFLHEGEEQAFVPGRGGKPLQLGEQRVGLAICADITHREHVEDVARLRCSLYAAGCFITEGGYAADADLLQGYAREYRMTVLMANYGAPVDRWSAAGRSAIWSEDGTLVTCAPPTGEAVAIAQRSADEWRGFSVND